MSRLPVYLVFRNNLPVITFCSHFVPRKILVTEKRNYSAINPCFLGFSKGPDTSNNGLIVSRLASMVVDVKFEYNTVM